MCAAEQSDVTNSIIAAKMSLRSLTTLKGAPISMTVCHCKDCNLYYIRDVVFDLCREKYGTLLGKFIREPNGMNLGQTSNCRELAPESLLHINGYNVNQTVNLSPDERRKILTYVIESRIMDKRDSTKSLVIFDHDGAIESFKSSRYFTLALRHSVG